VDFGSFERGGNPENSSTNFLIEFVRGASGNNQKELVSGIGKSLTGSSTPPPHVYLTYVYTRNVEIPGLTIHFLNGPGRIEGDHPFFENLHMSHEARAFLENFQTTRATVQEVKTLPLAQLEQRLESIIRASGEWSLNPIRDKAKAIAPDLGMEKEFKKFNDLISDLLPSQSLI
jgi:hypothetical protein